MQLLNVSQAKAQLSAVIEKVVSTGEEFIIGRSHKPEVKIIPYRPSKKNKRLGAFKGEIRLKKGWDEWPADLSQILGIKP